MTKPDEQIISVAQVLYNAWKVGYMDSGVIIHETRFDDCPDAYTILKRLNKEGIINLVNSPYDIEEDVDMITAEIDNTPKNKKTLEDLYHSYSIIIPNTFEAWYEAELTKTTYKPMQRKKSDTTISSTITLSADNVMLKPSSYSNRTGVLSLTQFCKVEIVKNGKTLRPNDKKYEQCRILDCLFKSVNRLNNGVEFSTIIGVHDKYIDNKKVKRIRNTVDEINRKFKKVCGLERLIFVQGRKVFISKSYL